MMARHALTESDRIASHCNSERHEADFFTATRLPGSFCTHRCGIFLDTRGCCLRARDRISAEWAMRLSISPR